MGWSKYNEDNQEIMEERYLLHEKESTPILILTSNKILTISSTIQTKQVSPQKHKKQSKRIVCMDCGTPFLFSGGEQTYYEKHKLYDPKRCVTCRQKQREKYKTI